MRNGLRYGSLLIAGLALGGCELDFTDPNNPTEPTVLGDPQNLMSVAVGLQAEMANAMGSFIYTTSLIASETGVGTATFANFVAADAGDQLEGGQFLSEEPWQIRYRVVKLADDLLGAAPGANLRAGTRSGILALAKLARAKSFGELIQLYPTIPIVVGIANRHPPFVDRAAVLTEALRLLNEARQDIITTPLSDEFLNTVLAPGFDLPNTIDAMIARYSLIAGDLTGALAAAGRVNLSVISEFRHSTNDPNSVRNLMYTSGNAWQMRPRQELRLQAEAGDQRAAFWVTAANVAGANGRTLDELARYTTADAPFPVYLPDEMRLIMAEVHARQNNLGQARTLINAVRTQCGVSTEPAACLPALPDAQLDTQAEVLAEILHQRRYELFLQGVRQEDLRRFGAAMKYEYVPYPGTECARNQNAPC
jgi:hypothetical protein